MVVLTLPVDESHRLEALHGLGLLDASPEPRFERFTRLACCVAKVPIALICFIDAHRQWFLARQGLDVVETSRTGSFCDHTILREELLIVPDAHEDSRFSDNPLVSGAPFVRFYAGYPIHAPGGARVGTLCVMDTEPRDLSSRQRGALTDLAALVDAEMSAVKFDIATRTVAVGVHERRVTDRVMWWSDAMWDIFGQDRRTFQPSADNWLRAVHPEDRDFVKANGGAWGGPRTSINLQYRIIRPDGTIRHLLSIASSTEKHNGRSDRIAGITFDVSERVIAEQHALGQQLELRDSSHQAGMAEIATAILHSIGNVVNSMGITNQTLRRDLKGLRADQLERATTLIGENKATLAQFLTKDARGQHLPDYLCGLSTQISANVQSIHAELDTADQLLQHLRDIISAQKVHANVGSMRETIDLRELIDSVLLEQARDLPPSIEVVRRYDEVPLVTTDRHKLHTIFVILLNNAIDAVLANGARTGFIAVHLRREGNHALTIIEDSGVGMSTDVLSKLWRFGYTTKPNGQGFDLHNSANAAREIGATIVAQSDGANKGARFIVRLPLVSMAPIVGVAELAQASGA